MEKTGSGRGEKEGESGVAHEGGEESKKRNESISDLVRDAIEQMLLGATPGLCPSCHTQNDPDAKFCSQCGFPFKIEDQERYERVMRFLYAMEKEPERFKMFLQMIK